MWVLKHYCLHDFILDGFDEKRIGVWSRQFLISVVEQSHGAERVTSSVFYSRVPFCRRVLRFYSDCLIFDIHMAG
jgi:hypothetical protein